MSATAPVRRRVGILISGRGSNMSALAVAARDPTYPAKIALVLTNRPDASGLDHAASAGIPTAAVDHRPFGQDCAAFEEALDERLRKEGVDLICLAGFMRVLTAGFVERWHGRLLNIHPSLLPAFPGLDTHARALKAGVRMHGCTVHFVTHELDAGPIVAQAAVPVLPGDDEAALAARVLKEEHRLYPAALRLVAAGAARLDGDRVVFSPEARR